MRHQRNVVAKLDGTGAPKGPSTTPTPSVLVSIFGTQNPQTQSLFTAISNGKKQGRRRGRTGDRLRFITRQCKAEIMTTRPVDRIISLGCYAIIYRFKQNQNISVVQLLAPNSECVVEIRRCRKESQDATRRPAYRQGDNEDYPRRNGSTEAHWHVFDSIHMAQQACNEQYRTRSEVLQAAPAHAFPATLLLRQGSNMKCSCGVVVISGD